MKSENGSKFNVYAVVNGGPLTRQNQKSLPIDKAKNLEGRLTRGKIKATRVLITRAA